MIFIKGRPMDENIQESQMPANLGSLTKEWVKPTLKRLPISATSGGGTLNEGVGKGKGKSGPNPVS
jgi:hypothetical protein